MKLQIETYGVKHTIKTTNDDLSIDEHFDIFIKLLVSITFDPEVINNYIIELADELKDIS